MARPISRFGDYRIDPSTRELEHAGELVALSPKVFDCIAYLIEHRDRAVGRDELIAAVWGRADVSDAALAQTMSQVRRAVNDNGGAQTVIRTIPRFGYRWVAAMEPASAITPPAAPNSDDATAAAGAIVPSAVPTPTAPRRRVGAKWSLLAFVAFVTFAALVAAALTWRARTPQPAADLPLAVVLPVDVADGDAESAWMRFGAMDYLAARLRESGALRVLPSEQVVALLGRQAASAPQDAQTLRHLKSATGAAYLVRPGAMRSGSGWTVVLDIEHDGTMRRFDADAAAVLPAARLAAMRFLARIGMPVTPTGTDSDTPNELLARVDALVLSGELAQAQALIEAAPADLQRQPEFSVRAGRIAYRAGRLDAALALLQPLATAGEQVPADLRALAQIGLAGVALRHSDFDDAVRRYSDAIDTLGERGTPYLLGRAYTERGVSNGSRSQIEAAMADFGRARVELERAGDLLGSGALDVNIGIVEGYRGRYLEAVTAYDRAIALYTRFGVRDFLAASLINKIDAQLVLLDAPGALATSERAWEMAANLDNRTLAQYLAIARTRALLAAGQLSAAAQMIERYGTPGVSAEMPPHFALLRARLLLERGDPAAAARDAEAILARIEPPVDPTNSPALSEAATLLIDVAVRGGQTETAERILAFLQAAGESALDRERTFAMELGQAKVLAARGDEQAARRFGDALARADRQGRLDDVVAAGVAYARYLLARHRLEEASAVVGRLAPYAERDYRAARATAALYAATGDRALTNAAEAKVLALAGERDPHQPW